MIRLRYVTPGVIAAMAAWGAMTAMAADANTRAEKKDAAFIKEAAHGGKMEVMVGKLAVEKGQDAQVKQLGQRLQDDHSKANEELMQIAQKRGVVLTEDDSRKDEKAMTKLHDKTGAAFDQAFVENALTDHEKDIQKFQRASQEVNDAELKGFIEKTLPVLRQHLEMARAAGAAVGVDQRKLNSADRFLSEHGSTTYDRGTLRDRDAVGAGTKSETGRAADKATPPATTTPRSGADTERNK
ncbi:MAG: DUF4142 domain-containing protein [Verrucomicrobiota bacterium]